MILRDVASMASHVPVLCSVIDGHQATRHHIYMYQIRF